MAAEEEGEYDMFDEEGAEVSISEKRDEKKLTTLFDMISITIADPEKRVISKAGLKMQDTYVAYLVETKPRDDKVVDEKMNEVSSVWRRYSEFELLRNYLTVTYPTVVLPPLPEKRTTYLWTKITADTFDPEFLERRRAGLESFLHRICRMDIKDDIVVSFLKQEENWRESVMATEYQAQADSWLKTLNASLRVKQIDPAFEDLKTYANELQTDIAGVLKARAKLADRVYALYKVHSNYARIFKEWSAIEDASMAEVLRKCSVEMDKFSGSVDSLMEEEELYAEQLKEYHNFGNSLKAIIKKHEALQYDVEYVENQLMSAHLEKKQVESGAAKFNFSGMKARLFGGDTPEQKEAKLAKIEENIMKLNEDAEIRKKVADDFGEQAKDEVLKFKRQKQIDLKEILTNYVILQIKMSKEAKVAWDQFKIAVQSV